MKNFMKIAAVSAGLAAIVGGASPALAQSNPYGYGYGNNGAGVVGQIINSVTGGGYGQYPQGNYGFAQVTTRGAVNQCTAAIEQGRGGYGQRYANQGYNNQGYGYQGQANGGLRVIGITNVERRNNGGLRVTGIAQSGGYAGYNQRGYEDRNRDGRPDGYNNGYGNQPYNNGYASQGYGQAQVGFTCKVDGRGAVTDVRVNQNSAYRRGY